MVLERETKTDKREEKRKEEEKEEEEEEEEKRKEERRKRKEKITGMELGFLYRNVWNYGCMEKYRCLYNSMGLYSFGLESLDTWFRTLYLV